MEHAPKPKLECISSGSNTSESDNFFSENEATKEHESSEGCEKSEGKKESLQQVEEKVNWIINSLPDKYKIKASLPLRYFKNSKDKSWNDYLEFEYKHQTTSKWNMVDLAKHILHKTNVQPAENKRFYKGLEDAN